jgi:hypothetical protein
MSRIKDLEFEQHCHRQVVDFVKAWSKKENSGRVETASTRDTDLIAKILDRQGDTRYRYDILKNNLDSSINDFSIYRGELQTKRALPLMLVCSHAHNNNMERVIVHVIFKDLAFISAGDSVITEEFLTGLLDDENKSQISDSAEGSDLNAGGYRPTGLL